MILTVDVTGGDMTYYAVSAQVLPTLLLGFVLGFRSLNPSRSALLSIVVVQMVSVLAATGACVWAIRHGHSTDRLDNLIFGAYIFILGGFAVLIARWFLHPDDVHSGRIFVDPRLSHQLSQPQPPPQSSEPTRRQGIRWLAFVVLLGALIIRRRRES
jgi:hypothetical protein